MKLEILEKYKKLSLNGKLKLLILIVVVICIILLIMSVWIERFPGQIVINEENNQDTQDIEQKLAEALSQIKGAGKVKVMITYEDNGEIVPAYAKNMQKSTDGASQENQRENLSTQEQVVTVQDSGQTNALIVQEKSPKVMGVLVIAQGAKDLGVKFSLIQACKTILGVENSCVEVFEMGLE